LKTDTIVAMLLDCKILLQIAQMMFQFDAKAAAQDVAM
jgi:hypothetical protein